MARSFRWNDDQIRDAVKESISLRGTLIKIGLRPAGGNYATIARRIATLGLDTSHWLGQAHLRGKTHSWGKLIPLDQILTRGSSFSTFHLKERLLKAGLLPQACAHCGLAQWMDRPIPLELDHINGDRQDHTFVNLRVLCPNCHALTPTYRAKNAKYPHIPTLEEIRKGIQECGGIPQYARRIGVGRGRIYDWLKSTRLKRLGTVEEPGSNYLH
jgi:hypothetical protein